MSANDNTSTLKSYMDSATSAIQSGIASITGSAGDQASANQTSMAAIDDSTSDPKVDETPISPVQRRDSLEKHLQHRPEAQDLKNRHILLDTNAAP